jgi:RNA polymerase sigma-70 factor (ECF subfamily)
VQTEYRRLVAYVAVACGSLSLAEEAVQEAVARAWERSERGQEIRSWKAWVTVVALNHARSRLRRVMAERRALDRLTEERRGGEEDLEEVADLQRAMGELPFRQRQVLVLRFFLGDRVAEIASALGMSEGAVRSMLYRARRALAARLGDRSIEENEIAQRG